MNELADARSLAHGTYADVIVVEYRKRPASTAGAAQEVPHVVLEFAEGTRVIDRAQRFEVDGMLTEVPPKRGAAYRVTIGPNTEMATNDPTITASLRYELMNP